MPAHNVGLDTAVALSDRCRPRRIRCIGGYFTLRTMGKQYRAVDIQLRAPAGLALRRLEVRALWKRLRVVVDGARFRKDWADAFREINTRFLGWCRRWLRRGFVLDRRRFLSSWRRGFFFRGAPRRGARQSIPSS